VVIEIRLTCSLKVDRNVPNLDLETRMRELGRVIARQAWWAELPVTIRLERLDVTTSSTLPLDDTPAVA
jgi:hypothetical protein